MIRLRPYRRPGATPMHQSRRIMPPYWQAAYDREQSANRARILRRIAKETILLILGAILLATISGWGSESPAPTSTEPTLWVDGDQ